MRNTFFSKTYSSSGTTLVEVLLYVVIISVVISLISGFLFLVMQSRIKAQTVSEVEQQGAFVTQAMKQAIHQAQNINTPSQGSNANQLSLDIAESAQNPTVFDLSGAVIRIQEGLSSPVELTNASVVVSNLDFYNVSRPDTPGIIRYTFTLSHTNPNNRQEYSFSKTFQGSIALRPLGDFGAAPITTCEQYCQSLPDGYTDGTCRQNGILCFFAGENYESGGNGYCSGPAQNACCCD